MADNGLAGPAELPSTSLSAAPPDLTGRQGIVRNVLSSWAGHLVFVAVGFVLPRMLDRRIGQEALGVWDFGWSLISYFGLVSGGVMTAVSRYVARFRAAGDVEAMNGTVNTGLVFYACTGSLVGLLTVVTTVLVPILFADRMAGHMQEAQWVIFLLGLSMTTQFVFAVFNGILTGCHRWGIHNAIASGSYALTAAGMILALMLGGELRAMAAITLAGEVLAGLLRVWASYRYCPGLRISLRAARLAHAREMIVFGAKTMLAVVSFVIMYQTNSLLIGYYMGPAALALYSRPSALVRHTRMFVNKLASVLSPSASAFEAAQDQKGLQELLIKGTRYSLYLALPMLVFLTLLGGDVLHLWMGARYADATLIAVLAIGHLMPFSQQPTHQILMGIGRHGFSSMARLAAGCCTVVMAVVALGTLQWGLVGAALAVVVPRTLLESTLSSWYVCRLLGLSHGRYWLESARGPVLASAAFAACLLLVRWAFQGEPAMTVLVGFVVGGSVMGVLYWYYVIPKSLRNRVTQTVRRAAGRHSLNRA